MKIERGLAVVAGGGGALGTALCQVLGERGYRVLCAGRDRAALQAEVGTRAHEIVEVELTSAESVQTRFGGLGEVEAFVYNAGRIDLAPFADTTAEMFTASWQANALGAFHCARALVPRMLERGRGALLFVGATASVRGGARSHAFAAGKHALRGFATSLAKELGPKGVHVAHLVVDGKIWGERTRQRFPAAQPSECLDPAAVAEVVATVLAQPRSAWTFEMDLRPSGEKW